MSKIERIDNHVTAIAKEVYDYMFENSCRYEEGWIPIELITRELDLEIYGCPQNTPVQSERARSSNSWLFGLAARRLEDLDLIEFDHLEENQSCRVKIQITI